MSQDHLGPVHAGLCAGHGGLPLLHHHDRLHLLQGRGRHAAPGTGDRLAASITTRAANKPSEKFSQSRRRSLLGPSPG